VFNRAPFFRNEGRRQRDSSKQVGRVDDWAMTLTVVWSQRVVVVKKRW
jgi:hypothetical protein